VTTVFPEVADDTDSTRKFRDCGGGYGVWLYATSRLAQRGNMINVDGKLYHCKNSN
jgi:hypothetical protein